MISIKVCNNRGYSCSSKVASSDVSVNVIPGTICGDSTQRKTTSITETRRTATLVVETNTPDGEGFGNNTADILMASWRKDTFPNYSLYMKKWFKFASSSTCSPVEPPGQVALTFLTSFVRQGKSFSQTCMARSALSLVINQQQNVSFGNSTIDKRYIKEIVERNSTLAKFQFTWIIYVLFNYFPNMQDIQILNIQELTQMLVKLMTLI